jgi:hypothetical protein
MSDLPFNSNSFYKFLDERKLMGCRNRTSGTLYVPPRSYCFVSHNDDMEWEEMSGKGKLVAYTVITVAPTHMLKAGYNFKNPYCTGIVQLEEGPKISGQILGVDIKHPESIKIGTPVQVTFIEREEGETKRTYLGFQA